MPPDVRKSLVESHKALSLAKQAGLLEIGRTSIYKRPTKGISDDTIALMHKIDHIHTDEPTWGYRTITSYLHNTYGIVVNRKRVRRLMRQMGIYAIYPKPNLSKLYHAQYVRPYLLRNMEIVRPDQVWGVDITYIPLGRSFVYLFVIIDWYSRYIVDWELSSTLDKGFVLTCMRRALGKSRPQIINSDQGGHFTNPDYVSLIEGSGVRISMDGKGQEERNKRGIFPQGNAVDMAAAMGIDLLTEEQYAELQKLGKYDTKTSSWLKTPADIRKLGGAIFADRRYDHIFVYHNSAPSFYSSRAFRGCLRV